MQTNKVIGAVEIGTSKVVVLVGEIDNGGLNIIGRGDSTSMGVTKGEIVDFGKASDAAHAALRAAERNAGATIEAVYLAQTGGHLQGFANVGAVPVSAQDGLVSRQDMKQAVDNAKRKELQDGRLYIHHIQNGFVLDGRAARDPLTMRGDQLEVNYWHVHGNQDKISDNIHVINGYGLQVEDMILSSICSGSLIATPEEKAAGVVVVDIGRGTTDWVVYRNGTVWRTGVIRIGGDHITNDLSIGLRVSYKDAEKLKCECGKATIDQSDKGEKVWLHGDLTIGDRQIPKMAIYQIIKARIDELFTILRKELHEYIGNEKLPCGVLLTGGTAKLCQIDEAASRVLTMDTRCLLPPKWVREDLRMPEYSTVLGLLQYGMSAQNSLDMSNVSKRGNLLEKVRGLFSVN